MFRIEAEGQVVNFSGADVSGVLLRLYGLAQEASLNGFQDQALELLEREAVRFDSAMWGAGVFGPGGLDIHMIHLHRQPAEMLASYQPLSHLDTAADEVTRAGCTTRGFHARSWFERPDQAPLRAHGERFRQANFMISVHGAADAPALEWLTLFRADEADHCSATDVGRLAWLMPHLIQAQDFNRLAHQRRELTDRVDNETRGMAICGPRGNFYHCSAAFEQLLGAEFGVRAARLPDPMLAVFGQGRSDYRGRHLVVTARVERGLLFLRARPRLRADQLGARERLVADLAAQGKSQREIAEALQRSPATIGAQMRSIYNKLGVGNVAAMIAALRELDD